MSLRDVSVRLSPGHVGSRHVLETVAGTSLSAAWPSGHRHAARRRQRRAATTSTLSLHDSAANREDGRLDAVLDLQLHQDVRDVILDGLRADVELAGDLGVV